MNLEVANSSRIPADCAAVRASFSAYLDGAITGIQMASLDRHLKSCDDCSTEFTAWRSVQAALGELRPLQVPSSLQRQLRTAMSIERERGTYLSPLGRLAAAWKSSIAPVAFRFAGGLAATLVVAAGITYVFGTGIAVQANDDRMAHLIGPHLLYSYVPPQPIETGRDVLPIIVQVKINAEGRAYDYTILEGPDDAAVRLAVEQNLLASIFKPATVFGIPVRGEMVLTYTSVSVHG
jgi:Putative zinc-finger